MTGKVLLICFLWTGLFCDPGFLKGQTAPDSVMHESSGFLDPFRGMIRSAVLPGWGQWMHHRHFKAALIFSAEVTLIGLTVAKNQQRMDFQGTSREDIFRRERDRWLRLAVLLYAVNLADAYLDPFLSRATKENRFEAAWVRSAVLPGWGQWYNGQKIKAVLVLGGELALIGAAVYQNQRMMESDIEEEIEFYRNDRGRWIWYGLGFWMLNIIDAYVDAHLKDFDVGPMLQHDSRRGQTTGVSFQFRF